MDVMNLSCRAMPIRGEARLRRPLVLVVASLALLALTCHSGSGQLTADEREAVVGDAPADPGPLAVLSGEAESRSIQVAMRKVADWQARSVADSPSQDWTFATLYVGMLSASETLHEPRYRDLVTGVAGRRMQMIKQSDRPTCGLISGSQMPSTSSQCVPSLPR
jgi:hypothetical protein